MISQNNIESLVLKGRITSDFEYEKALTADRKLKLCLNENPQYKTLRYKLRDIIDNYESAKWSEVDKIDDDNPFENDETEYIEEQERLFLENRKKAIEKKIIECNVTLEDLASILGRKSKSYMLELMNGIKPFSLRDLIIINRVFNIQMDLLIPRFLSKHDEAEVEEAVKKLDNPKVKVSFDEVVLY
jgi:hypothetical protein